MDELTAAAYSWRGGSLLGAGERALVRALALLLAAEGPGRLPERIVRAVRLVVACEEVVLYTPAGEGQSGPVVVASRLGGGRPPGPRPGSALLGRALAEGRPVVGGDGRVEVLALPLIAEDRRLAVLELRCAQGAGLRPLECERAFAFASLAALALARAEREAILEARGQRDPLTGLYNYGHCQRVLAELCRREARFALVMLDLDDLKLVNDRHGHLRGDEVLHALGVALRQAIRGDDLAFRIGGDEFLLLLPGKEKPQAASLLARIESGLRALPALAGLSLSHGIAVSPAEGTSAAELLECVDRRLYQHKRERKARRPHPAAAAAAPPPRLAGDRYC